MGIVFAMLVRNRTAVEVVAGVLVLTVLTAGFMWHERTLGAAHCVRQVMADAEREQQRAVQLDRKDSEAITHEIETYAAAVSVPVAMPVVRLCPRPAGVPRTASASRGGDAQTPSRTENQGNPRVFADVGEPLGRAGRDADAQLAMLQNYVTDVCQRR
jgi:hypothetical protein